MENPMEAIHKLCERVHEEAKKLDLESMQISVLPGKPDRLVVTFGITAQAVESMEQAEQRKFDEEFEAMVNGTNLATPDTKTQEKVEDMNESIEELMKKWEKGE